MRTVSWVLLAVVSVLLLVFSLLSARVAYLGHGQEWIGGVKLADAPIPHDMQVALQARRGTAAAYAAAYATLLLLIAVGPYRRGDVGSWWAALAGAVVLIVLTALRQPLLGTTSGIGGAGIVAGITVLALLLDVGRLSRKA